MTAPQTETSTLWSAEFLQAITAARSAGHALRDERETWAQADSAVGKDIKLAADRNAEALILEALDGLGHPVLAEESGASGALGEEAPYWVVDPLDGTFNYMRGMSYCAVSIALLRGLQPVVGVVYDFGRDRLWAAAEDVPTRANGQLVQVSDVADTGQAALATGFPVGRDYRTDALSAFIGRIRAFKKVRMIGSAASSLALVSEGTVEAYFEEGIRLWDVAAGLALVRGAGGRVDIRPAGDDHRYNVYAGNAVLPSLLEAGS